MSPASPPDHTTTFFQVLDQPHLGWKDTVNATTYTYRVKAVNAAGASLSNEAMIQIP